jgi:aspartate/tyrosine/aromatic aminotransferase
MSLTGLKKEQAKEYFNKARSTKVEDACRAYLHPEKYQTSSSSTATETQTNGSTGAVSAAA